MACRILVPQPASPPLEGRFLTTRPLGESQKWLLNWIMGRGVKSFELEKSSIALKGLLVEIWTLNVILVKTWKEKSRATEKAVENRYII